jgi:hypothetical protein
VARKKKQGGTPGFVLTYARLALIGGFVLALLGTFTTLLYNSIVKQLDDLQKQIQKLDEGNDEERDKDRGRFDQVDQRLDQNAKDTDSRFDKLEDRLTRVEMSMVNATEKSGSQLTRWTKRKKKRGGALQNAYDFHLGMGTYEPETYAEKAMKEARGVGVARVLEPWSPDGGMLAASPPLSRREVRQLARAERRARRKCRRPRNFTLEECLTPQGTANLAKASNRLAMLQNFEANVRH